MELSDELYDRIEELSETGNEAMESEDYAKAISCFQEALDILPEPKEAGAFLCAAKGYAKSGGRFLPPPVHYIKLLFLSSQSRSIQAFHRSVLP